jgi:type II secretory pathway component PulM
VKELLARIRARIAEWKRQAQTLRDRASDQWSRFSPRDQQIITIAGIGGTVFLVGMIAVLAGSHLQKLDRDIAKRAQALQQIRDLKSDFKASKDRLDAINLRLRAQNSAPKTFLEDKAKEVNMLSGIDRMEERSAPPNDLFKAELIEVNLKKVTLANVTRYLYKIESANAGMTVHSLELSPNFQDGKYLDGKLIVQSLRPKE